jgi:hypothetical protein
MPNWVLKIRGGKQNGKGSRIGSNCGIRLFSSCSQAAHCHQNAGIAQIYILRNSRVLCGANRDVVPVKRRKYQDLIDYYYRAAEILRDRLPYAPPALFLTQGTTYYGAAYSDRRTGRIRAISLSEKRCWPIDHDELINTICHEIAHMFCFDHTRQHQVITDHFTTIVNENWK